MHTASGPHRQFNVRSAKRDNVEADENMIDRTSGLNKDMQFDTVLKDSRWERFNANVDDDQVDQAQFFERERIKKLSDEREKVQKKTFTKWVNSHLSRVRAKIADLYIDLRDGRNLIVLLEVLSGEKLPKAARGRMRIHCLENVEKVLSFLRLKKVKMENVGPADIVDGNTRLTLGLIWTIILRFQIKDIEILDENKERRSAKDALLLWCQMKTADYDNVNVVNFTTSWRNGLAFNAIIHKHLPDLVEYDDLPGESDREATLEAAFKSAEEGCGIHRLLDAEDVAVDHPDEKSIITQLAAYYHYFTKLKDQQLEGKRIGGVLDDIIKTNKLQEKYEQLVSDLLKWIEEKTEEQNDRDFANSLPGIQKQCSDFEEYRKVEKPPKIEERGNLEVLLFELQTKLRANNRKSYTPKEGQMVTDVNTAWGKLEDAEHSRDQALREELRRQKQLERSAEKFKSKCGLRQAWINEAQKQANDEDFGNSLATINAALIRQNTLEVDIQAYETRVDDMAKLANFLEEEKYHDSDSCNAKKDEILGDWRNLESDSNDRRKKLEDLLKLHEVLGQCDELEENLDSIKMGLERDEHQTGQHLTECDELNSKHQLVLKTLVAYSEDLEKIEQHAKSGEPQVASKIDYLKNHLAEIENMGKNRSKLLEESRLLHQFYEDVDDHDAFIKQQNTVISNISIGSELQEIESQLNSFDVLAEEIQAREPSIHDTINYGGELSNGAHFASKDIDERATQLKKDWQELERKCSLTKTQFDDTRRVYQLRQDCHNLIDQIIENRRKCENLDFSDLELATATGKLAAQGVVLEQIKSDVNDNIVSKKLPKLQSKIEDCNSHLAEQDFLRIEIELEKFREVADQKTDEFESTKELANDLQLARTTQEWIDEKLAVLEQLEIPDQIDQVELVKRKVEGWEHEVEKMAPTVEDLKELPDKYTNERRDLVESKLLNVLQSWDRLASELEDLKQKLASKQSALEFGLNCDETIQAADEKIRLAEGINDDQNNGENPTNLDLNSVMAVQKKLGALDRDRDALKQRIKELENQGHDLAAKHPERAGEIGKKLNALKAAVNRLDEAIREKEAGLGAAGALHTFIRELDDLETWVKSAHQALDDAPSPSTLQHALELQNVQDSLRAEIESYEPSIDRVCKTGKEIVSGRPDEAEMYARLNNLSDSFNELKYKCDLRSKNLEDSAIELAFNGEANTVQQQLENKQVLMKNQLDNLPVYVQEAESAVKNQDAMTAMLEAMHPRVVKLKTDADSHQIGAQPVMVEKADDVAKKYDEVMEFSGESKKQLENNVQFARFNVDCAYFRDWLKERKAVLKNQDEMTEAGSTVPDSVQTGVSANDGMDCHIAFQKHHAFMQELKANHEKLKKITNEGDSLKETMPNRETEINEKVKELHDAWNKLKNDCEAREKRLFEHSKAEMLNKNIGELDNFTSGLVEKSKPLSEIELADLATVNRLLKNQDLDENALDFRKQELDAAAEKMAKELTGEELADMEDKVSALRKKFDELEGPMSERRKQLEAARDYHQLKRDIAEELRWIEEKMRGASSTNYGDTLHAVQVLQAKHDTLTSEVKGHEARILELLEREHKGEKSVEGKIPEQEQLGVEWKELNCALSDRETRLQLSAVAQKYLFDADEAKEWISERELCILGQDNLVADDEESANRQKRRHAQHQAAIDDYSSKIENLAKEAKDISESQNPEAEVCNSRQQQLEKAFASLKQLARERSAALNQKCEKLKLKQEFDEFSNWVLERERITENSDTGRDAAHCQRLLDRFEGWADETKLMGQEKLNSCQNSAENVMQDQPSAANDITEWKGQAGAEFQELLENIDNRKELLQAAYERLKCLQDCQDATDQLNAKKAGVSKEIGSDAERTRQLQRQHETELVESEALINHAKSIDENAGKLSERYAGDEQIKIQGHRDNLNEAIGGYEESLRMRERKLKQVGATHDFNNFASDLLEWIEETNKKIDSQQRPADKAQVHALLQDHLAIKNDMEAREPEFQEVYRIEQSNVLDDESWQKIDSVIRELKDGYSQLDTKWRDRNAYLLLAAGVTGFWSDCAHADTWLKGQEQEDGQNEPSDAKAALAELDAFESNILAPWNEKFKLLQKLTKYEDEYKNKESEQIEAEKVRLQKEQEQARIAEQERELAEKRKLELEIEEEERERAKAMAEQMEEKMVGKEEYAKRETANIDEMGGRNSMGRNSSDPQNSSSDVPSEKSDARNTSGKQRAAPAPPSSEAPKAASNTSNLKPVAPKPPKTVAPQKEANRTTTETAKEIQSFSGILNRKQELDNRGKHNKHRSWNQLFVVLSNNQLMFFKDSQTAGKSMQDGKYNSSSRSTFKGEAPLPLKSCTIEVANDYTKRSNVFRLKLSAGAEYLFQAQTTDEMNMWVQNFKAIQAAGEVADDDMSVTSSKADKSKRGFFGRK